MANWQKAAKMLGNLERYSAILREIATIPRGDLLTDIVRIGGAKYYLQTAIECCTDIAHHIIASEGWRAPRDYADAFVVLNEHGVIPDAFLSVMRRMVRFRNRLVHLYWEVDNEAVCDILQKDLGDLDRFGAYIRAFISEEKEGSEQ